MGMQQTRGNKPIMGVAMTEHQEQAAIINWCDLFVGICPELDLLYAIPNGASLSKGGTAWRILAAEGAKKGIPDLCLPVARGGYYGLYIELKFRTNQPTPDQANWLDRLTNQGYLAVAAWGADEAIEILIEYLDIRLYRPQEKI
jgi:hypothetical protein